jgi:small subunit ribosomal protein S16
MYRLIISEKTKDPYGDSLEILGSYNPFSKELQVKNDRVKYWLEKGAQMSPTVNNLLVEKKIINGKKVMASKPGKKAVAETPAPSPASKPETAEAAAPLSEEPAA